MKYRNPKQCDGWIDYNLNISVTYGGEAPVGTVACHLPAEVEREEKGYPALRLCVPCASEYDYAHT